METKETINNELYEQLGERWYYAYDNPVALLRAEAKTKNPWVINKIRSLLSSSTGKVLDIGCGAGFLTNDLAQQGFEVTGLDLSADSLRVAQKFDKTKTVRYDYGSAYDLPYAAESFDIVCAMDFLEHVSEPSRVVAEASRVLRPQGLFFFHTFNRNPISWLIAIKGVEWFIKNTPANLHIYALFIKPSELIQYCAAAKLILKDITGIRPVVGRNFWPLLWTRVVPQNFQFCLSRSQAIGYLGVTQKIS